MRPRLSVCGMVSDTGDRFLPWAERVLEVADEFVLCVDSCSKDATLERLGTCATPSRSSSARA